MAHRSVPAPAPDVESQIDPFWHDAFPHRPSLGERLAGRFRPPSSWLVAIIGVLAVAGVSWWLLRPAAPPVESSLPAAATPSPTGGSSTATAANDAAGPATTTTEAADLVVQAAGAVAQPGVYELPPGARVDDLVKAAGGLTPTADADRVNLAAPVADGERIWVPSEGETAEPDVVAGRGTGATGASTGGDAASTGSGAVTPAEPVDLNSATGDQLDALPGVGPATATAILAYRDEHGRFASVEELLEVRGIGDAKLEQLRPLVRV